MKTINTELTAEISASYKAGRPPINCQDPSNPAYYDTGEDASMTNVSIELMGVDIADVIANYMPELYDSIVDSLYDEGEKE